MGRKPTLFICRVGSKQKKRLEARMSQNRRTSLVFLIGDVLFSFQILVRSGSISTELGKHFYGNAPKKGPTKGNNEKDRVIEKDDQLPLVNLHIMFTELWKIPPCLFGKLTISTGPCSIANY